MVLATFFLVFLIKTDEIISFPKEKQAFAYEKHLKPYKYNGFGIKNHDFFDFFDFCDFCDFSGASSPGRRRLCLGGSPPLLAWEAAALARRLHHRVFADLVHWRR